MILIIFIMLFIWQYCTYLLKTVTSVISWALVALVALVSLQQAFLEHQFSQPTFVLVCSFPAQCSPGWDTGKTINFNIHTVILTSRSFSFFDSVEDTMSLRYLWSASSVGSTSMESSPLGGSAVLRNIELVCVVFGWYKVCGIWGGW